jgi:phytoene synthase
MMSPILGADRKRAAEAAVHLGIAMQMTNIARDVLEDARNGRRYLPGCWVNRGTAKEIAASDGPRQQVSAAIARLLDLADRYYASAALGFPLIPRRARTGIEIAASIYREIGIVLRRKQYVWWNGRVTVPLSRKLWIALRVCVAGSDFARTATQSRIPELSRPLAGLPGVP